MAEAVDLYLERRSAVLSSATIAGYRRIQKNLFSVEKGPKTTSGFRRVHIPKPVQKLLATAVRPSH